MNEKPYVDMRMAEQIYRDRAAAAPSTRMVSLELEAWHRVLNILASAPWAQANPLIMTIGEQLRMQEPAADPPRQ